MFFSSLFLYVFSPSSGINPYHSLFFDRDHFRSGIICGSIWGSFAVRDHLRSWDHLQTRTVGDVFDAASLFQTNHVVHRYALREDIFSVWRHDFFVLRDVHSQRVYLQEESLSLMHLKTAPNLS